MTMPFRSPIDMGNQKISNVADPSAAQDVVNLQYLQAFLRGLDWKASVRAAASTNINTSSPGATIDGVSMASNDRVLLMGQSTGSQNGIWVWNGAASAMTRAVDADVDAEVTSGLAVTATEGTANGDKAWVLTTNDPIVVGTTALVFAQLGGGGSAYTNGAGLSLTGNVFAVVPGAGILADGTSTRIDPSVVVRKFAANVGDNSSTNIDLAHNFGTRDITWNCYLSTTPWVDQNVRAERLDTNTLRLVFPTAPTTNQYRAVVHA